MPVYTPAPAPTSPTYTRSSNPGGYVFDDPNVLFNDPVVMFEGGNVNAYTLAAGPISPAYSSAPSPS